MLLLTLAFGAIVILVFWTQKKNKVKSQKNILYPFTGTYIADRKMITLKNSKGQPQIDCANKGGGEINIVGAFFDITDPYGSCSGISSPALDLSCGIPGGKVICSKDSECGTGMSCAGGFCQPSFAKLKNVATGLIDTESSQCGGNYCPVQPGTLCKDNNDCKDPNGNVMICEKRGMGNAEVIGVCKVLPNVSCFGVNTTHNTCASFPLCSNADLSKSTVKNNYCAANTINNCMSRDASAYMAGKCDGKETCSDLWNPTDPNSGLGPLPCNSFDVSGLPIIPGQGGNYSQGYHIHGLYTCIPKTE